MGTVDKCLHGMDFGNNSDVFEDDMTLAFYSVCDCCDMLMHNSTLYQMCKDGRTLCFECRDKSEPETYPTENWSL